MSEVGNGSATIKTVKDMVLEHDALLRDIKSDMDQAKGALWLAVALGIINVIPTLLQWAPVAARGATGQ